MHCPRTHQTWSNQDREAKMDVRFGKKKKGGGEKSPLAPAGRSPFLDNIWSLSLFRKNQPGTRESLGTDAHTVGVCRLLRILQRLRTSRTPRRLRPAGCLLPPAASLAERPLTYLHREDQWNISAVQLKSHPTFSQTICDRRPLNS